MSAQYINRHQNELDLWAIDTASNTSAILLTETDAAYVDVTDNLTFLKDNSFIWTSEKDGHNHLYHYSKTGKLINQLTEGNWEVTAYYGCDEKSKHIYSAISRNIYKYSAAGNP